MVGIPGLNFALPSGPALVGFLIWILFFIVLAVALGGGLIFFLLQKSQRKVVELDMNNRRMRIIPGRIKKNKQAKTKQFWLSRVRKFLPQLPGDYSYHNKNKEAYVLLKDKNGMYHNARVPTWDELRGYYAWAYNIDLDNLTPEDIKARPELQKIRDVYLLPNPHEDLDWLSGQCIEADKEFKLNNWWQSPVVMVLGTAFVCFLMVVVTVIFAN